MNDNITHPKHYTSHPSGIECIEITRHYNFNIGNAIKYLWRAGLKQEQGKSSKQKEIEDLQKAIWYIQDYINTLQQENLSPDKDNHNCCNGSCNCKKQTELSLQDLKQLYDEETQPELKFGIGLLLCENIQDNYKKEKGHYIGLDRENDNKEDR